MSDSLADLVVNLSADFGDVAKQTSDLAGNFKAMGDSASNAGKIIDAQLDAQLKSLMDTGMSLSEALASLGGDLNKLPASFSEAGESAQQAAEQMNLFDEALSVPYLDEATGQLNLFATELEPIAGTAAEAGAGLDNFGMSAEEARAALETLLEGEVEIETETEGLREKFMEFGETLLELTGIALTAEALKEFVVEALSTYAAVERADVALTALTGNASKAGESVESLKTLAQDDALAFPQLLAADQRMVAFGFDADKIPATLQAVADASAATGNSLDSLASSVERIVISGRAGARQLVALGLSTKDLASVMGVAEADVAKAFKNMDQTARLDVMTQAMAKYKGVAADMAETLSGAWQKFKTDFEFAAEGIGAMLAPVASAVMTVVDTVVRGVGAIADAFHAVPASIKEGGAAFDEWLNKMVEEVETTKDVEVAEAKLKEAVDAGVVAKAEAAKMTYLLDEAYNRLSKNDIKTFMADLGVSIHVMGMLSSDALAAVEKITKGQEDASHAYVIAKEAYEALNQSYKTGTALASGHVATLQDVVAAYRNVLATQQAASGHFEMLTEKLKGIPWKDQINEMGVWSERIRMAAAEQLKMVRGAAEMGISLASYRDLMRMAGIISEEALVQMKPFEPNLHAISESFANLGDVAGKVLKKMGADVSGPTEQLQAAYAELGLTMSSDLNTAAAAAHVAYEKIKTSGVATAREIGDAWMKMSLAQIQADHAAGIVDDELYAKRKKNIEDALKLEQGAADAEIANQKRVQAEINKVIMGTFNQVAGMVSKDITNWKNWGKDIQKIGQDVFGGIMKTAITAFFGPMVKEWSKAISQWLSQLLGFSSSKKASDASEAASTTAAATTESAARSASDVSQVTSTAAVAGAAAYAAYIGIPFVGEALALEAEAAAIADVMALVPVASAAGGWDIGSAGGLTQTHPYEMILPQEHADTIRSLPDMTEMLQNAGSGNAVASLDGMFRGAQFYGVPDQSFVNRFGEQMVRMLRSAGVNTQKF